MVDTVMKKKTATTHEDNTVPKRKSIVIVGGGTAGWVTCAYLAARLDVDITIVHSDEIDIIGVGESTSPTVKQVADTVGVPEKIWMRDARATFKFGVEFFDWRDVGSRWFHSFDAELPEQIFSHPVIDFGKAVYPQTRTSIDYFLKLRQTNPGLDTECFNHFHGPLPYLLDSERSHFNSDGQCNTGEFPGYAYHVNAFAYSQCLRKHIASGRIKELVDTVVDVQMSDHGVEMLVLKSGRRVSGDVFIDCTGFRRLLIGRVARFTTYPELVNNRAIFGAIKGHQSARSVTQAHAQDAGWIWSIPTWGQMGSGHVYCGDYMSDDQAHDVIRNFWASRGLEWQENNRVRFTAGHMDHFAVKNVVANGLAQSFIEPLEATSIMITAWSAIRFADVFERDNDWNERSAKKFNSVMVKFFQQTMDFVYYHYALSDRRDTPYWRDRQDDNAVQEVSDRIREMLTLPWPRKGETLISKFSWSSMLVGYGKPYMNDLGDISDTHMENYVEFVKMAQQNYRFVTRNNPPNLELLRSIHEPDQI